MPLVRAKATVLDQRQSQQIIAVVCSPPPEGRARWTVRLLTEEVIKRKLVPRVGRETIRVLLESHDLKSWREKNVVERRDKTRTSAGHSSLVTKTDSSRG
jgi:putative transposase